MNNYCKKFEELLERAKKEKLIPMRDCRIFDLLLPLEDESAAMRALEELEECVGVGNRTNLVILYNELERLRFLYDDLKYHIKSKNISEREYLNFLKIEMDLTAELKTNAICYEIGMVALNGYSSKHYSVTFEKPDIYYRAVKRIQKECPVSYSHFSRSMSFFDKTYPETED
jgi:hypothetical protein